MHLKPSSMSMQHHIRVYLVDVSAMIFSLSLSAPEADDSNMDELVHTLQSSLASKATVCNTNHDEQMLRSTTKGGSEPARGAKPIW